MKKFIWVVVLVILPSFANASWLRCTEGLLAGGLVGSAFGDGNGKIAAEALGALLGCDIATSFEKPREATTVTRTVTVLNSGTPAPTYSTPCPSHWEGSYFMDEGYRRSGGITRDGCGGGQRASNVNPAVYKIKETRTPPPAPKKYFGPTVHNYTESQYIDSRCKSGNPGADGNCLLGFVQSLRLKQLACEGKTKKASCPPNYNAGLWAHVYDRLGKELVARQVEMQGGEKFEPE